MGSGSRRLRGAVTTATLASLVALGSVDAAFAQGAQDGSEKLLRIGILELALVGAADWRAH